MRGRDIYILLSSLILLTFIGPIKAWGQFGTMSPQPQAEKH